jgi:hypothetical protein
MDAVSRYTHAVCSIAEQFAHVLRVARQQLVAGLDELRVMTVDDIATVDPAEQQADVLGVEQVERCDVDAAEHT